MISILIHTCGLGRKDFQYLSFIKSFCFYPGGKDGFQASEKAAWHPRCESQTYTNENLTKSIR